MTGRTAPRRPGRPRALGADDVIDAALALLDEGGVAAMSVRAVAARVGVAPNAVYTYVPDKAALVGAVVERLLGEVDHSTVAGDAQTWRDRLEAVAMELRNRLSRHPGAVALLLGGPMDGPNALAVNERLLQILTAAGLGPQDAARASYLLVVHVLGSLALEVADDPTHTSGPLPPDEEREAARLARTAQVPAELFPLTAGSATTVAGFVSTAQFLWGLRCVLDGIEVLAERRGGS